MSQTHYAKIVKIIGTRYPRLRTMIRNHPYVKIVGISIANCLEECFKQKEYLFKEGILEKMVEEGIAVYEKFKIEIDRAPTLEQKRHIVCERLKPAIDNLLLIPA